MPAAARGLERSAFGFAPKGIEVPGAWVGWLLRLWKLCTSAMGRVYVDFPVALL